MHIVDDEDEFVPVSREFVRRYVSSIITILNNSSYVDFDAKNISEEDEGFVFELCFQGLVQLDTPAEIEADEMKYIFKPTFLRTGTDPREFIGSKKRIHFHGAVLDDVIPEVVAEFSRKNMP